MMGIARTLGIRSDPDMRARLRQRFDGYSCTLWHSVYAAVSGVRSVDYLPEDIFFNVFERRLNPRLRRDSYRDKNFYDRMGWPGLPVTVLRVINGELFDRDYRSVDLAAGIELARQSSAQEFVVKPSRETRGGFRVAFVPPADLEQTLRPKLKPNSDWIVQEAFQQHHLMAALNASSVNTLRIMTIRLGGEVAVVSAFSRIGVKGARVDNISSGSIAAGVTRDEATGAGRLGAFACDDKLKLHTTHPDHGYRFDAISLPFFQAAEALCKDLHAVIPDLGLLSWDIAIDAQGKPSVIEFNISRQEILTHQACNGPVFAPYIDRVLGRHPWLTLPVLGPLDRIFDIHRAKA
jgi:putative polysaccharide biosynthesis protein